jgi:hypothetical protein
MEDCVRIINQSIFNSVTRTSHVKDDDKNTRLFPFFGYTRNAHFAYYSDFEFVDVGLDNDDDDDDGAHSCAL